MRDDVVGETNPVPDLFPGVMRQRAPIDIRGAVQVFGELVHNALSGTNGTRKVRVTLHGATCLSVEDDGVGMPVESPPGEARPALELLLSDYTYNRMQARARGSWVAGVGLVPVTAIAAALTVDVRREGRHYRMVFARGVRQGPLQDIGPAADHGTRVTVALDDEVMALFSDVRDRTFDEDTMRAQLATLSYLHPEVMIVLDNEITGDRITFRHPGGIADLVRGVASYLGPYHPVQHARLAANGVMAEIAFQFCGEYQGCVLSFVNDFPLASGGVQESLFLSCLRESLSALAQGSGSRAEGSAGLSVMDILPGLVAVIALRHPNPRVEMAGRTRLIASNDQYDDYQVVSTLTTSMMDKLAASHGDAMGMLVRLMLSGERRGRWTLDHG